MTFPLLISLKFIPSALAAWLDGRDRHATKMWTNAKVNISTEIFFLYLAKTLRIPAITN